LADELKRRELATSTIAPGGTLALPGASSCYSPKHVCHGLLAELPASRSIALLARPVDHSRLSAKVSVVHEDSMKNRMHPSPAATGGTHARARRTRADYSAAASASIDPV
jgi:hypothetical protein